MNGLNQSLNPHKIQKGVSLLGLHLSESELNELQSGNYISLEGRGLGEIGSLFILAAALSSSKFGKAKKTITFQDLPKVVSESETCSGIPIYSWNLDSPSGQYYLYLTLVDGNPALRTSYEFH